MATITKPPVTAPPGAPTATPPNQVADRPRPMRTRTLDEWTSLGGALLGSVALVWLVFEKILAWSGTLGFLVCWYIAFLALFAAVTSMGNPRPVVVDRLAAAAIHASALLVLFALGSTIIYTILKGFPALLHLNFFTQDMAGVGPDAPLTKGGVLHAIAGTLVEVAIAVVISLPLGIGTAVYMTEVGGRLSKTVRTVVEAMTALPDILAGLFIYTTLIVAFGFPRTGLAAALALAVTMIPIIARSAEVVLRVVPGGLREAGLALGASQWQTVRRVVLPTAKSGLATALILGIARAVGETAPVLITSGASTFLNVNPLNDPMNSLPLFIYTSVRSGQPQAIVRGFGAATLLLGLVFVLFIATRFLARQRVGRR